MKITGIKFALEMTKLFINYIFYLKANSFFLCVFRKMLILTQNIYDTATKTDVYI